MFTRFSRAAIALTTVMMSVTSVPAAATASARLAAAALDAPRTSAASAERHCHDLQRGLLTCFAREVDRDATLTKYGAATSLVANSTGYVIAWAGISYTGSSVVLSQDHANLGAIGWNDRISSYKVYTTLTGAFYENTNYTGLVQQYCCYAQVGYVGDAYNDKFSSFNLP